MSREGLFPLQVKPKRLLVRILEFYETCFKRLNDWNLIGKSQFIQFIQFDIIKVV